MPDHMLRVDDRTYRTIKGLASEGETLSAVVARAVEAERRRKLIEDANAAYARLKTDPAAWDEELAERAEWDCTLMDGLEDDPWQN